MKAPKSASPKTNASSARSTKRSTSGRTNTGSGTSTNAKGAGTASGKTTRSKATTSTTSAPSDRSRQRGEDSSTDSVVEQNANDEAAEASTRETPVGDATNGVEATDRGESTAAQQAPVPDRTHDESDAADLLPIPGASLRQVEPTQVVPNAWQPRREFDEEALAELVHSVREFGLLQPIVVRPIPEEHPLAGEAEYELIMGERRLRASKAAGLETIPAIVKETPDDVMLRDALLENLHRSQLNPLEEASAYQQLLDDFGITQEELAQRIGRSRPQVSNTLRLLKLPLEVQRRVAAGVLSAGHARAVLSVGEPTGMAQLADKIINEDLSVRAAEAAAAKVGARSTQSTGESGGTSGGSLTGYLDEVGERLGDRLNTRVKVTLRRTKGQIVVDFASVADLNRILGELGEDVGDAN
ncbi:ParB family chromosome partitioning protein [Pseudoclavibacter chungangensis]|uniref:ParB/RepB/Spo0J family partition protein n=1 Tax=Pseudoclavibacter chungangensis TaxID=587635 RepID=UPI00182FD2FC|nr:ParB/RepB/Spo0J family partition protein [Pseudoclavibacter chungangensis]NYJ68346.1 ParB family chromosome partitioning protein [Pseudoclavibacter chungangensis]